MSTKTESKQLDKEEMIDPRCIVKFRPADDWEGEYGFDWFREGDYGEVFEDGKRGSSSPLFKGSSVIVKSKSEYKKDNLVGRYYGGFRLCNPFRPQDNDEIRNKEEFTDAKGNMIYSTWSPNRQLYVTLRSKKICLRCQSKTTCNIFPLQNGNGAEYPFFYENTRKPVKIDPDLGPDIIRDFLIQGPSFNKTNLYEKNFENSYNPIQIKDSSYDNYFVPTISLFYQNEYKEEGKWGQSAAAVKLLIKGNNIDSDIKKIAFDFECSLGIEIIDPSVKREWHQVDNDYCAGKHLVDSLTGKPIDIISGTTICKNTNTNYYEKIININLTEDFLSYSIKEGNGEIKIFATIISSGERFLAGKLVVEKCIPKSVEVVFVQIPVEVNSKISYFPDIDKQKGYLRRFLSQAHVVPNIRTINVYNIHSDTKLKLALVKKLNKILDNHRNSTKDKLCINTELVRQLETIFNDECPKFTNVYKLFLLGAKGEEFIGMAGGIPSKSAVISAEIEISTVCHELLHCFGLYHSFSNNSPYTLEQYKTSNIMDYPAVIELLTLWKWQCDKIRLAEGMKPLEESFVNDLLPKVRTK